MHHAVCISVSTKRNSAPNFLKVKMLNGVRFNVCTTGMTSVCFPQHQMYSSGARQLQSHQVIPKFTVVSSSAKPKKYTNKQKTQGHTFSLKHADLYNLCGQRFLIKHFLFQSKYCHTTSTCEPWQDNFSPRHDLARTQMPRKVRYKDANQTLLPIGAKLCSHPCVHV